jgi:VWFA-related protein
MSVKDEATSVADAARFRVNVKLVLARVVVRDSTGHAVGNLRREDFELFDNGKPQAISGFDMEHEAALSSTAPVAGTSSPANGSQPAEKQPEFPVRYVAYVFDDVHLTFQDLMAARAAANHQIDALNPIERAAVFSTSGQTELDFTDDRARLHQALNQLMPHPISGPEFNPCPDISFYQADLIADQRNPEALQTAINQYLNCASLPVSAAGSASNFVQTRSQEIVRTGERESRLAIDVLRDAIRRIMAMPGQRSLVLVSPGFLTPSLEYDYNDVIDHALRGQVVINTLDARGLYVTIPGGEASHEGHADIVLQGNLKYPPLGMAGTANVLIPALAAQTAPTTLELHAASAQSDILSVLAYATGGKFFHNNNDLDQGFRQLAEAPEYYYILGFTPQSLKTDGKFHTLKVNLKMHGNYDLQARRGYYAPRQAADPAEEAKREVNDEMLSSEELHDLPVVLHTQFFKASDDSAKLTVMARVDVKRLHYKRADDRNQNQLTIVTAVFDRNGNLLQGNQKVVQMSWKNETLQSQLASGLTFRTSFDVKPGHYLVRVVARDTEQQLMSAENGAVEIP